MPSGVVAWFIALAAFAAAGGIGGGIVWAVAQSLGHSRLGIVLALLVVLLTQAFGVASVDDRHDRRSGR